MFQVMKSAESTNQMTKDDWKKNDPSLDFSIPIQRDTKAFIFFQKIQGAMRNLPDFIETCKAILGVVIEEIDAENCSLMLKDAFSLGKIDMPLVARCSTFMETGEMNAGDGMFIYTSDKMHRIKEVIDHVANTDLTVFIQGESGVGKEVVAQSIHLSSSRRDRPFVKVNCAALPHELLESELFGYEKGAFTGAYCRKEGKFELAQGGTIFLDEISEISSALQAKLLQVLQDKEFTTLGGKKDLKVDVRILAATNTNVEEVVKNGRFRKDLYYRLNVVNITVPPLRERKEEIPIFIEYFLDKFAKKYNKEVKPLSDHLMKVFIQHPWLGNVRELENLILRFVVLGDEKLILEEMTPVIKEKPFFEKMMVTPNKESLPSLKGVNREAVSKAESEIILKALEMTNWNRKKAANKLNISYKALLYKIKTFGLERRFLA